jgi:hypothetical protein
LRGPELPNGKILPEDSSLADAAIRILDERSGGTIKPEDLEFVKATRDLGIISCAFLNRAKSQLLFGIRVATHEMPQPIISPNSDTILASWEDRENLTIHDQTAQERLKFFEEAKQYGEPLILEYEYRGQEEGPVKPIIGYQRIQKRAVSYIQLLGMGVPLAQLAVDHTPEVPVLR